MTIETYYYFKPDTSLRAAYGGAAIQNGGDSSELTPATLCQRYFCRILGTHAKGTRFPFRIGTASDTFTWIRVSSTFYSDISSYLSASEASTATTTMPTGWTINSVSMNLQPHPSKINIFVRGDSISFGLGTTTGDTRDTYIAQGLGLLETLTFTDSVKREAKSSNYYLANMSIGGSSWANTSTSNTTYPHREDLSYNQKTRTIPLDNVRGIFIYWLGTNDLAYDGTLTGAQCWARASARVSALASEFPNLKIILGTTIKRGTSAPFNSLINDYNTLIRQNYISAGAHVIMDFEANVPQVNITTGDTTNTTYYTDGTHLTTAGHTLLAPVARDAINAAVALF